MAEFVSVPESLAGDYALRMQSDAMAPGIAKGDLLVVRKAEQADAGSVVVAMVNEEATVRRYRPDALTTRLEAENPTVEDIVCATGDVVVIGVVVGLVRSL